MDVNELAKLYREAWLVARRVPFGRGVGYSSFWPEINPNRWEVYHSEGDSPRLAPPTAESVDRMVECMRWLRWLSEDDRKLIWLRASGLPWREISSDTGIPRTTVHRYWHRALLQLVLRLNA